MGGRLIGVGGGSLSSCLGGASVMGSRVGRVGGWFRLISADEAGAGGRVRSSLDGAWKLQGQLVRRSR